MLRFALLFGVVFICASAFAANVERINKLSKLNAKVKKDKTGKFPKNFEFGGATAAFQIEGAWDTDGKGPSIWDTAIQQNPGLIIDGSNATVAADSYNFYEDDIKAVKSVGMDFYRLSISWPRILPTGDVSVVNELGIIYYNKVIDKIIEYGMKPTVTMYHYDLPQRLQSYNGIANAIFVRYFEQYANLLFQRFGDRVKTWITFNEPYEFCLNGYGRATRAPLVGASGTGEYLCAHHVLLAHASVYHLYKTRYQPTQKGKLGITLNSPFYYSKTNDSAGDRALHFQLGWFANPLFGPQGGYPDVMVKQIRENSEREGRGWSRLPEFSPELLNFTRGASDFLGLNYYTARIAEILPDPIGVSPSWDRDTLLNFTVSPDWKRAQSIWLYSVPEGVGNILRWIKKEYNNPEVIITENGWSDAGGLNDEGRIEYLRTHLTEILKVVVNEECNLTGYTVWSVIDNFEWTRGYSERFGLFAVNFTSPRKERTPKLSTKFMREVIETRTIPSNFEF